MNRKLPRLMSTLAILLLTAAFALAGCTKKEEPAPPQGGTYYTGPMEKKGAGPPGGAPGGAPGARSGATEPVTGP